MVLLELLIQAVVEVLLLEILAVEAEQVAQAVAVSS
jgi:hypothetical protein